MEVCDVEVELREIHPVNNQVDMEGRKYGLLEYGKAERKCRGFIPTQHIHGHSIGVPPPTIAAIQEVHDGFNLPALSKEEGLHALPLILVVCYTPMGS